MRRVLFSNICLKTVELCRLMETVGEWGDREVPAWLGMLSVSDGISG